VCGRNITNVLSRKWRVLSLVYEIRQFQLSDKSWFRAME
jgi:hypothetical protein